MGAGAACDESSVVFLFKVDARVKVVEMQQKMQDLEKAVLREYTYDMIVFGLDRVVNYWPGKPDKNKIASLRESRLPISHRPYHNVLSVCLVLLNL